MKRIAAALLVALSLQGGGSGQEGDLKVVNLDKLNSEADEVDPFIAPNNLVLLYATNKGGLFDIHVSQRSGLTAPWPAGKPFPNVNTKDADERSPFLHDKYMYFAANRVPDEKLKDLKNYDLWRKTNVSAPLPLPGISEREDELHPWITPAGKEFYFSRRLKEGWKLMVALGPTPGPIGMPREVGFPAGFHAATLSSQGLTMYLHGPVDKERMGIYRSKRVKVGAPWSKPEPLVNLQHPESKRGDMYPCLTADGNRLYFASDRPGGKGGLDLWYVATNQLK